LGNKSANAFALTFAFAPPHTGNASKVKRECKPMHPTDQMNGQKAGGKEGRTANKVLPKAGLNGFDWAFVQGSTFVLRLNFCANFSRLRQYPNRWQPILKTQHRHE
jgi:hypothetical protein